VAFLVTVVIVSLVSTVRPTYLSCIYHFMHMIVSHECCASVADYVCVN